MTGAALHDVTFLRPGGSSPVTLPSTGYRASWAVKPPSTLSAEVVTADLIDAFGTTDLWGAYWVEAEHPTAGVWAGVVTGTEPTLETGTTEVAARDYTELLAARTTAKVYDVPAINPGGMARKIILDAGRANPTWIEGFELDPLLPAIPFATRAEQVLAAIDRLADESGAEWEITHERILRFLRRLGRDVSASRQLVQGRQIVAGSVSQFGDAVRNELLAIPADQDFVRTTSVVVADADSRRRRGLRQDTVVFDGMTTETQLKPAALAELAKRVDQGMAFRLTVMESDADGDEPCFSWFSTGDIVGCSLPSINWEGTIRIRVRTLDTETNQMTITAEAA